MNNVTPIPVRLETFEGPLDLLLHLIDKNKINIYDIPISEITDQYLDYVQQMKEEKLEVASEFLVMAATLLDIKSRMLLPREEKEDEEEEGDPREELVQRLLDYKLTRYQSEELKDKSLEASKNVFRSQDLPKEVKEYEPPVDYDELLGDTTLKSLTKIFEEVLKRQKNRVDPVRSTFGRIRKEEVSVEARTEELLAYFRDHSTASFRTLLEGQRSRQSLIVTFLILLDFIKSGIVHIRQSDIFGEIEIFAGALPEGGMGPQETMPSNKAEARALRKAQKQQEKQAADMNTGESDPVLPGKEPYSFSEAGTEAEEESLYGPGSILSSPGPENAEPEQLGAEEDFPADPLPEKKEEKENLIIEETSAGEPEKEGNTTVEESLPVIGSASSGTDEDTAAEAEEALIPAEGPEAGPETEESVNSEESVENAEAGEGSEEASEKEPAPEEEGPESSEEKMDDSYPETAERAESAESEESAESAGSDESAESAGSEESAESAGSEESAESAESEESAESAESEESAKSAGSEESAESAGSEESAESAESDESAESAESDESAVYRLIRSKDWETVLDEYMEDEGLAELLEEEKEEADPSGSDGEEDEAEDESCPEGPDGTRELNDSLTETGSAQDLFEEDSSEKGQPGPAEENDIQEEPSPEAADVSGWEVSVEDFPDPEEEILDREAWKEQDTAVKESACGEVPVFPVLRECVSPGEECETLEEVSAEAEELQEVLQPAGKPEDQTDSLSEGTAEEEWKKAKYLQPSRLYFSPWADRWKCLKSPRPSKSRSRMHGRQWKRSGRSSTMRAAACRSIATMMPYSSLPEQSITNT